MIYFKGSDGFTRGIWACDLDSLEDLYKEICKIDKPNIGVF